MRFFAAIQIQLWAKRIFMRHLHGIVNSGLECLLFVFVFLAGFWLFFQ